MPLFMLIESINYLPCALKPTLWVLFGCLGYLLGDSVGMIWDLGTPVKMNGIFIPISNTKCLPTT